MKRIGIKLTAVALVLLMVFLMTGCGAQSKGTDANYFPTSNGDYYLLEKEGAIYDSALSMGAKDDQSSYNPVSDAKLIYTASVGIQTTDLDEEYEKLVSLVEKYGGYFEEKRVQNGSMYSNYSSRYGNYKVRIPKENYRTFLEGVQASSYIVSIYEDVDDVGEAYFDLENKLETLKIKQDRLQELLKKANSVGDIIEIENSLSDVEYQINSYSTQLNHYDSLIDYSTITVEIDEVEKVTGGVGDSDKFFPRLLRSIKNGSSDFVNGLVNFINWFFYNFLTLLLIAIIIFALAKFQLIRRFFNIFRKEKKEVRKIGKKKE